MKYNMICTSPAPLSPTCSEISVGSPSPPTTTQDEDYYQSYKNNRATDSIDHGSSSSPPRCNSEGVKSFTIADILGHDKFKRNSIDSNAKIVRPWDLLKVVTPIRPFFPPTFFQYEHRFTLDYHHQLHEHFRAQAQLLRHMSFDIIPSESGSERSSSVTSDCCSPEITKSGETKQHKVHSNVTITKSKNNNETPLDALFQMTNKPFDEAQGDAGKDLIIHWICFYALILLLKWFTQILFAKSENQGLSVFVVHDLAILIWFNILFRCCFSQMIK